MTAAMSPYDIQPTDRVLLIDTTGGGVVANAPAAGGPSLGRPIQYIDAKRNFGVDSFTLNGNGKISAEVLRSFRRCGLQWCHRVGRYRVGAHGLERQWLYL